MSATKIFARTGEGENQFVIYSMSIAANRDLAMILPLPVKKGAGEKAVHFISLKEYPNFFEDMELGFPMPATRGLTDGINTAPVPAPASLEVVRVGNFEASFVPTVKDFARLDARFRLPAGTWNKLPGYAHYGFAVFKLKKGAGPIHPMAFSFPRRNTDKLFFPTVHIHDGKVHAKAEFDHVLYCQPHEHQHLELLHWNESPQHARSFMKLDKSKGLIEPDQHCYKMPMTGELPNKDTFLAVQA
ncbi:hypothetical protein [Pedosphaera parvula]|uniref:hypothetical protein n=1 Tax=Pedosphaera parvula TaxID=1032527 RepID=UPI0003172C01|nr:hypothetical protein [Pedosphaera parvula]